MPPCIAYIYRVSKSFKVRVIKVIVVGLHHWTAAYKTLRRINYLK